jgi:hypothetical protein
VARRARPSAQALAPPKTGADSCGPRCDGAEGWHPAPFSVDCEAALRHGGGAPDPETVKL